MAPDLSPTARALLALEAIQNNPGITAERLGSRLGVTERAARRYVAILREAGLPIESLSGPYGGYRAGRGLRLPPLMFSAAEALGIVMAVLEGHREAADPADLVGGALAKIVRVLPERVAGPVHAFRHVCVAPPVAQARVSPELTTQLIEACTAARRLRLGYRMGQAADLVMEVDPWAVVLRHGRWYLLGWSHTRHARRVLRVDRIIAIETLPDTFTPPPELDALRTLEEHLSQGWTHAVDIVIDATVEQASRWLPRSLGHLEPVDEDRARLRATTDEPAWYARQLATIPAPFRVLGSAQIQRATAALGRRLVRAAGPS
ncbi:MAG TPA: WYL domain-containing protein [Streptosporangiaceae bacterium]|nr:WYL domain-containing protein [Streptosporangiaceae bacterium]